MAAIEYGDDDDELMIGQMTDRMTDQMIDQPITASRG